MLANFLSSRRQPNWRLVLITYVPSRRGSRGRIMSYRVIASHVEYNPDVIAQQRYFYTDDTGVIRLTNASSLPNDQDRAID